MKRSKKFLVILISVIFLSSAVIYSAEGQNWQDGISAWFNKSVIAIKAISFFQALFYIDNQHYESLTEEQIKKINTICDDALKNIVKTLDKHSHYLPAELAAQMRDELNGQFEGIGIVCAPANISETAKQAETMLKENFLGLDTDDPELRETLVKYLKKKNQEFANLLEKIEKGVLPKEGISIEGIIPGGPAEKADLQSQWYIVAIDGEQLEGMEFKNAIKLIAGPKGTKVKLTLLPPKDAINRQPKEIEVVRDTVKTQTVKFKMLTSEIGYIKFDEFYLTAAVDFKAAVEELQTQGMKNLIIDLRNNPGGFMIVSSAILNLLLPPGSIEFYTKKSSGEISCQMSPLNAGSRIFTGKIAVLINGSSASASELTAMALRDNNAATIIGERSYGKGSIQAQFDLPDGSGLRLTIGRYFGPANESIHEKGIIPDIAASDNPATPEDEVILEAIKELQK